jgi:hypothetical protein
LPTRAIPIAGRSAMVCTEAISIWPTPSIRRVN